jgi:prepilin-type N-terminal cleavage/methylation domain-containing protein/prepilin-type processing-associated H-X9-DG protein
MDKNRSAFSLLEMLVAMAVAAVVAALAISGASKALESSKVAKCLGNLRAIGSASALYSADNNGRIPQSSHQGPADKWRRVLRPYLEGGDAAPGAQDSARAYRSPVAPAPLQDFSYAINDFLTAKPYGAAHLNYSRRQSIDSPAQTLFFTLMTAEFGPTDHFHFASSEDGGFSPGGFSSQVQTDVRQGSGHYLFVDGHVERLAWEQVKNELQRPGSKFIDPTGQ